MKTPGSLHYKIILIISFAITISLNACGQSKTANQSSSNMKSMSKPENPYYSHTDTTKLSLPDAEWKKILSADVYEVSRQAATERPFTGKYWNADLKGTYYCATCGRTLFRSEAKFSSTCGWPSFFEQKDKTSTVFKRDSSLGMESCTGHLLSSERIISEALSIASSIAVGETRRVVLDDFGRIAR